MKYVVFIEVEYENGCIDTSSGFFFHRAGLICATRHAFSCNPKDKIKSISIQQILEDGPKEIGEAELLKPLSQSCEEGGLDLAILRCSNYSKAGIRITNSKYEKSKIGETLYFMG